MTEGGVCTDRKVKVTIPGPCTQAVMAQNDYYKDKEELAYAFADVVKQEIQDAFAAGADVVQLDEPWMVSFSDQARLFGIKALNRAIEGVKPDANRKIAVHLCLGYAHVVKKKAGEKAPNGEVINTPFYVVHYDFTLQKLSQSKAA